MFIRHDKKDGLLNVRINAGDPTVTMEKIHEAWKSVDPIHPFDAEFYDDAIEGAYSELSAMIKVIGFLSFIAISIASLGLLGMVVFTTENQDQRDRHTKSIGCHFGQPCVLVESRVHRNAWRIIANSASNNLAVL
ncbi:MAG: hypothetical protein WDO15_00425 [Bacteroidota bacterium]